MLYRKQVIIHAKGFKIINEEDIKFISDIYNGTDQFILSHTGIEAFLIMGDSNRYISDQFTKSDECSYFSTEISIITDEVNKTKTIEDITNLLYNETLNESTREFNYSKVKDILKTSAIYGEYIIKI